MSWNVSNVIYWFNRCVKWETPEVMEEFYHDETTRTISSNEYPLKAIEALLAMAED